MIYKNINKHNSENVNEKTLSEVKYLEVELVNLLNTMNNIDARDYTISVTKVQSEKNEEKASGTSSQGEEEGNSNNSEDSSGNTGDSSKQKENAKSLNAGNVGSDSNERYELKAKGVLLGNNEINWDIMKTGVENLYTSLPTITMDLYNRSVSQDEILAFNSEYDKLAIAVKEQKKEETLSQLSKIYDYLPSFAKNEDANYQTIIESKANILKAYSKLDSKNWDDISNDVKNAIDVYSKLLSNPSSNKGKQNNINKGYIMINELQNAVSTKDEAVFLVKYKNLLEEMDETLETG